ncbi:MAG: polysaccharide biosynthesis tyrosine autokinase [Chthonomonadaceae bacterium]|nr:polysaccharide biosynthesis tyrosine autokinase [Chthonomonadaceae bacterium]
MNRDQLLSLSLTDLSLKELVALVKRRWWTILVTILIALALGALVSVLVAPTWRASKAVIVEGRTQSNTGQATDIVGVLTQTSVDYDLLTQVQIMSGFEIYFKALQRINYKMPPKLTDDAIQKMPRVNIQQVQTTNTVMIMVEDRDDNTAVRLAGEIPKVYEDFIRETQQDQTKRSLDFVNERVKQERQSLTDQLSALADYKTQNNVMDSRTESEVRASTYQEATRKLNDAISDLASAQETLQTIQNQKSTMPKMVDNNLAATPTEYINRTREQLETLRSQREGLLVRNDEQSERVKTIDAQISRMQAYFDSLKNSSVNTDQKIPNPLTWEVERSVYGAKAGVEAAQARVNSFQRLVDEKKAAMTSLAPIAAKLLGMETAVSETEQGIQRLLNIQNDVRLRNNALQSPVRDLTGDAPAQFVRPIWLLNLALAAIVGLVLGCIFALVRDVALDRVNSSTEASAIAEKEILGRIPLRASARSPLIADPQRARAFEAYRILRTSILLAGPDKKAFIVTSSVPKEGKTTVAGNLAVAMALEGKRTVLIDGNLRNPAIHKLFKVDRDKGLTDVLAGNVGLDEALKTTDIANLAILTAGADAPNSTEMVASAAMKDLIQKISAQADVVLVDSPSAFGYADTQSLVTVVKDVLFVTQLEQPSKPQMREAVGMVDFAGGHVLGVILNKDRWAIDRTRAIK